jgi:hypothetical protein
VDSQFHHGAAPRGSTRRRVRGALDRRQSLPTAPSPPVADPPRPTACPPRPLPGRSTHAPGLPPRYRGVTARRAAPTPGTAPARRTRHARPATNPILRPLLLALTLGAAACAFPDPTPTPEALALVGRWEGWLDGQALHITLEPAGLGGARLDPRGFGSSVLRGEGRWIGRYVLVVGQTTPDSVLFIVHTDLGPVDLHQAVYSDLVALPGEQIVVSDAALDLLSAYEARSELQPKYRADMLHIALASVADVDVLVSWNFEHMVRFDRIRPFNAANMEQGSKVLANPLAPKGDDLWNRRRSERSRCAGNPRPYLTKRRGNSHRRS